MSNEKSSDTALGAMSLLADRPIKQLSPKLQSTRSTNRYDPNDPVYLALTYCFDLMRRMEYLFKATKGFALSADPQLAREIQRDNATLNQDGLTWQRRSELAEEIMVRLYGEIGDEHAKLLKEVAGSK